MSYYFWAPSQTNELYHYGVLGMKWGVHKANAHSNKGFKMLKKADLLPRDDNDAPESATKIGDKANAHYAKAQAIRERIDAKATRKLQKLNAKYEKQQAKADRMFDKAERKSSSFLASKRSAEKAFKKASKYQFKANKAAARGKKWFDRMAKEYKKANISMTKENQEMGKELVRQVRANSRAMYAASYARG